MAIRTLRTAFVAVLAAVGVASLAAAQQADPEDEPLRVMFVNQMPETAIDLYWENHAYAEDHPDRRKLEARIAPRGGWHASETFYGHGECMVYLSVR